MMCMKKGNFAFKTAVEIFLITFAVAILLLFVWRNVSPGTTKTNLIRQKITLCSQYIKYDSNCNGIVDSTEGSDSPTEMSDDIFSDYSTLQEVCGKLGTPDINVCCSTFCGDQQ